MKKRGFGIGKWNGAGGKIHEGETVVQGGLRELEEEVGVRLQEEDLHYRGFLAFRYEDSGEKKNDTDCSVFTANYNGEVIESEEMMPKWFNLEEIPFDEMWPDDKVWLPELLKGENFRYEFTYSSLNDKNPQIKRIQ
ncbi:MAG: NUDIX domain-containing protein [Candidatus Peribacteria bacterium]|jgi:8-oxo-dGTP pyrophosphatase MutT (NUDIX family)|nr:NUDIX domain-containing protein [Candidatus Peribacteria bacterium]